jgi:hypothetical protein
MDGKKRDRIGAEQHENRLDQPAGQVGGCPANVMQPFRPAIVHSGLIQVFWNIGNVLELKATQTFFAAPYVCDAS